jgi:hypothetical protein
VEKKERARQATDDNIIRRMRIACWITQATEKHSEYAILIFSYVNVGYTNSPQCYVIRTLSILFILNLFLHSYPADANIKDGRKSAVFILNVTNRFSQFWATLYCWQF